MLFLNDGISRFDLKKQNGVSSEMIKGGINRVKTECGLINDNVNMR